jgi:hypothetical protein
MTHKPVMYRQCLLRKQCGEHGIVETTSWIPEPFCVKGKVLKLKDEDGSWENGWKVVSASELQPGDLVEQMSRVYLKTRRVTDI